VMLYGTARIEDISKDHCVFQIRRGSATVVVMMGNHIEI